MSHFLPRGEKHTTQTGLSGEERAILGGGVGDPQWIPWPKVEDVQEMLVVSLAIVWFKRTLTQRVQSYCYYGAQFQKTHQMYLFFLPELHNGTITGPSG